MEATLASPSESLREFWIYRLFLNLLGYASVALPVALVIFLVKRRNLLEKAGTNSATNNFIRRCIYGVEYTLVDVERGATPSKGGGGIESDSFLKQCLTLSFCFVGLQAAFLTWGVLQERLMTIPYKNNDSPSAEGEKFTNSQFLVFMNRISAFIVAGAVLLIKKQPRHTAPFFKYAFSSFSNIMSSWFQYEALKFVSFPTQVIAKSTKVIPVMLMGKCVSGKTYQFYEYLTALMISAGVAVFLLSSGDHSSKNNVTTFSGLILLVGYVLFDSFTSNWQGELFTQYKMSSFQMMFGVNFFSILFCGVSLIEQGGFLESLSFMVRHPQFCSHVMLLSVCGAGGQVFIFYTIATFGPVTFTIIMTIRQGLSILLSCIIYHHPIYTGGSLGMALVFSAIFLRVYANRRLKAIKAKKSASDTVIKA